MLRVANRQAPPSTRRGPPPDPPDTGIRIAKQKASFKKPSNISKPIRSATTPIGTLRKAEAIERALGAPQTTAAEIQSTTDTQMVDPFNNPSTISTIASNSQSVNTIDPLAEKASKPGVRNYFSLASLDLDHPGLEDDFLDCDLSYDDPPTSTRQNRRSPPKLN